MRSYIAAVVSSVLSSVRTSVTALAAAYNAASGQTISWNPRSFSSERVRCGVTPRSIMFATSGAGSCAAICSSSSLD
jgi:hypothetical protein